MFAMTKITALLLIVLLAGCAEMSRDEKLAHWSSRCDGYGFIRGTNAFAACIQSEERNYNRASAAIWEQPTATTCNSIYTTTGATTTCY